MAERLLILGGTAEGAALARGAVGLAGLTVVSSLAGRTRAPTVLPGETRVGGFGGAAAMADYLRDADFTMVVDATHPYAVAISQNAAEACAATGVPRLTLARSAWTAEPGDDWIEVDDADAAAARLADVGARAFLTAGRKEIGAFAGLDGVWFLVRLIDPLAEPLPLAHGEVIHGRGPFDVAGERALLAAHRIDVVIAKNSGGDATYGKIQAAREAALPVIMIRRPALPSGETVDDVAAALAWIEDRLAS
jgi:precorrin-6A/cobalt-precorrin-6A reductase